MHARITIMSDLRSRIDGDFDRDGLDRHLSFMRTKFWWKSRAARHGWDGRTHLYSKATGVLPTGLVKMARKWLKDNGHKTSTTDERTSLVLTTQNVVSLVGVTLRDDQVKAVESSVLKQRGIIHGATGSGKSEVAIAITKSLGMPPTLFLTGRKKLARQTRERFALRLGLRVDDIGLIQGGKWLPSTVGVYVAVVDTLISDKYTRERAELFDTCRLLFIDEAHHSASNTWYKTVMNCRARYRFGLTGTPVGRSDGGDLLLRACTGGIVARISAKSLIDKGILATPHIFFTPVSKPQIIDDAEKGWEYVYRRGIVENNYRNDIIAQYAKELSTAGKKTLILIKELDHGNTLKEMIENLGVTGVSFVNGGTHDAYLDKALEAFEKGTIKVLLATSILDEGIDIPSINALILGSGGKSVISTLQRIGRGLRRKEGDNRVFVFDFFDTTNIHLREHSVRRIETCKQAQFDVTVLKKYGQIVDLTA